MSTVKKRIVSLDVFRGITIAAMIFVNIIPQNESVPYFLHHAKWTGIYLADLVFPFFLFIVGVSMAYAFASRTKQSSTHKWGSFILRISVLFLLGLFINWLENPSDPTVRIPGVLQLIALSSLFAAPLVRFKPRWIFITAAILIVVHSMLLLTVGMPELQPGTLEPDLNIAGWIDMQIIGSDYMYTSNFDPEGIMAVVSATALVLLGLAVGRTLQIKGGNSKTLIIFIIAGTLFTLTGVILAFWVPIIKQLWTSSFILILAGLGTLILTVFYIYLDIKKRKSIFLLAVPLGRNALFIYVSAAVLTAWIQRYLVLDVDGNSVTLYNFLMSYDIMYVVPVWEKIALGLLFVVLWLIIASILHYKKIYIKL